jgi:hypothetical protein
MTKKLVSIDALLWKEKLPFLVPDKEKKCHLLRIRNLMCHVTILSDISILWVNNYFLRPEKKIAFLFENE